MFDSSAVIKALMPGYFRLPVPGSYFFNNSGRNALLTLEKRIAPVEVIDFTNEMIPCTSEKEEIYTLKSNICSPSGECDHIFFSIFSMNEGSEFLDKIKENKVKLSSIPHHFTADLSGVSVNRFYETRYWTEISVGFEIEEGSENSNEVIDRIFQSIFDYFVRAYRVVRKDSRIVSLEEIQEPILWFVGVIKFTEEELSLPWEKRFLKFREVNFSHHRTVHFPHASEKYYGADEKTGAINLDQFFRKNIEPSLAQELYIRAQQAIQSNLFRYAVLDAFTAIETATTNILEGFKVKKGVSKAKLENYRTEVTMAYKLNIEMPICLEPVSEGEKGILGNADKLRKLRNEIIHKGKTPSKEEAEESLKASRKLLDMFINRGFEV